MNIQDVIAILFGAIVMSPMIIAAWYNQQVMNLRSKGFPLPKFLLRGMLNKMLKDVPKTLAAFLISLFSSPAFVKALEYAAATIGIKIEINEVVLLPFLLTMSSASLEGIRNFLKKQFPNQLGWL